jgi:RNA polymerase sigma-70 factor (ECF subfamily)
LYALATVVLVVKSRLDVRKSIRQGGRGGIIEDVRSHPIDTPRGGVSVTKANRNGPPRDDLTPSLVVQLRGGEPEASRLLEELYRLRLTRFCLGYLGNKEEAEDVVQDVFLKVLSSATVPENFRAWIYEISRNRCHDRLRAQNRRPDDQPFSSFSQYADQLTGGLTRLVKGEQRARLWERLAALPSEQREVLLLRYTEGLSRPEIAQVLGIPEKLVKHRIYNGLEKLRRHKSIADDE